MKIGVVHTELLHTILLYLYMYLNSYLTQLQFVDRFCSFSLQITDINLSCECNVKVVSAFGSFCRRCCFLCSNFFCFDYICEVFFFFFFFFFFIKIELLGIQT